MHNRVIKLFKGCLLFIKVQFGGYYAIDNIT
jgi:hypothetical protein